MKTKTDPYEMVAKPGEMYGKIHDATKCCIDGWGAIIASVCEGPAAGGTKLKFQPGLDNVHEEGFPLGYPALREDAEKSALKWLKKTAKARGLKLKLYVVPPEGHAGKVKLVSA